MKLNIYNKEKWPITSDDTVFVPFCEFEGSGGKSMILDGDFCATTDHEAKDHWWFEDSSQGAFVRKMRVKEYIENYVIDRSDMNPFWTLSRLEMLNNNTHLFDNVRK